LSNFYNYILKKDNQMGKNQHFWLKELIKGCKLATNSKASAFKTNLIIKGPGFWFSLPGRLVKKRNLISSKELLNQFTEQFVQQC